MPRLVTEDQTAYVLLGDMLTEIHAQLSADLECAKRQPSDPPEVVEVWVAAAEQH